MRGQITLAGLDESRVSGGRWLDMVYAIVMQAPHEILEKMQSQITIQTARLRPDRETWGLLPDQVALGAKLTGDASSRRGRATKK